MSSLSTTATSAIHGPDCARRLGLVVEEEEIEWGRGVPAELLEHKLKADKQHAIRAVMVVHNETSTGVTSNIEAVRTAIDGAAHPALLLVDAVSSLGSIKFELDDWGVDVALTGAQKGLMLPPGMAILAASERAVAVSKKATAPRFFLDW